MVEVSDAVRAGAHFEADEVLFRIDPRDYQVAVSRAQAGLADARSALDQLEAEAEINRAEWRRQYPNREITSLAAREPQLARRGRASSPLRPISRKPGSILNAPRSAFRFGVV
ncbi:MAG: biotin/lipoyl-binding protein [Oceanicaulis sp.]|nr:biotin/lipoyl-binding protein [Oceanicaulis sp.]